MLTKGKEEENSDMTIDFEDANEVDKRKFKRTNWTFFQ
jgi:hypothetical protein